MRRKIISTSTSSLYNLDIKHNIDLIRLRLYINNVEFIDGLNINNQRLRHLMTDLDSTAVHTSPAPDHEVIELFNSLCDQGYDEIFITTLSSSLSKSYETIKKVAMGFKERIDIYVYDCKDLNFCEAMLALEAEHMTKQGHSMPEIATRLDQIRQNHKMLFTVNNLSQLIKNKKLSATAGYFARMLNIKPVLQMTDDGRIIAIKKIRSLKKAINYILDEFENEISKPDVFTYLLSTGDTKLNNHVINLIKQRTQVKNIPLFPVSTISLANQGPTGFGLCLFSKELPYAISHYQ